MDRHRRNNSQPPQLEKENDMSVSHNASDNGGRERPGRRGSRRGRNAGQDMQRAHSVDEIDESNSFTKQ